MSRAWRSWRSQEQLNKLGSPSAFVLVAEITEREAFMALVDQITLLQNELMASPRGESDAPMHLPPMPTTTVHANDRPPGEGFASRYGATPEGEPRIGPTRRRSRK